VQATDELTVYAVNKESKSTDSYLSLPVDTLGKEYFALTFEKEAAMMVVGTQNNTRVNITFPRNSKPIEFFYNDKMYR
jgi:hypothetical protein